MSPQKTGMDLEQSHRIGVFVCECGRNIAGSVDCEAVRGYADKLPGVTYTKVNKYTCSEPGQQEIRQAIEFHLLFGMTDMGSEP